MEKALIRAIREAKNHHHEYVTVEHLLYGLLHDELASYIISECGGSTDTLKEKLQQYFAAEIPKLSSTGSAEPAQTIAFNRVLQRAVAHVQSCGKQEVDSGDVLVSIFAETESHAVFFLSSVGVGRMAVARLGQVADDRLHHVDQRHQSLDAAELVGDEREVALDVDVRRAELALQRALVRLKIAEHTRRGRTT